MSEDVLPSIARMQPGDHCCTIYGTDDEHRAIVIDFVRHGVTRNEKMLYIVNLQTAAQLRAMLAKAAIDVDALTERGQLVVQTAQEAYLKDGDFDPDKMVRLLQFEADKAVAEGYAALRITGDMTWTLAGEPGSDRVIEYESKLNRFFPTNSCYAICQYDRRRFDAEILLDVLHTHPSVLLGTEGFRNEGMYYVPPESFLEGDRNRALFDRWTQNLAERKQT